MRTVAKHIARDESRVFEPVDVGDLGPVEGRDRHLVDPPPRLVQLHDDLGVEVEVVGVALERNRTQRVDAVSAVAAVPLAEVGADHRVLEPGEHLVADELVERHPAAARGARFHHA